MLNTAPAPQSDLATSYFDQSTRHEMATVISDNTREMINDRAISNPGLTADLAFLQVSEQGSNGSDQTRLSAASWDVGARSIQRHWPPL